MRNKQDEYYDFGYKYFGPFLYGFVRWLKKELKDQGYNKVFFFSRDGYMMKKAFDLVNDTDIESHYVYFSRRSLRIPLLNICNTYEESLEFLSWKRFISIKELMSYYGLNKENSDIIIPKDAERDRTVSFEELKSDRIFRKIFEENKEIIKDNSARQEEYLLKYTEQCGMRNRFAIVDIGWHGNMQYYLDKFYKSHGFDFDVSGFYIGILPEKNLASGVNGYVYDPENIAGRKRVLCFLGGYEKLFQSSEGSASGYCELNGKIVPELMEYEYSEDEKIINAINRWQDGALDFISEVIRSKPEYSDHQLTEPLIKFGVAPGYSDTQLFSFFYINDGEKIWFTSQKPLYKYRFKEFIHDFANSPWKTGFLKSVFRIPLPYYWIYSVLKKDIK